VIGDHLRLVIISTAGTGATIAAPAPSRPVAARSFPARRDDAAAPRRQGIVGWLLFCGALGVVSGGSSWALSWLNPGRPLWTGGLATVAAATSGAGALLRSRPGAGRVQSRWTRRRASLAAVLAAALTVPVAFVVWGEVGTDSCVPPSSANPFADRTQLGPRTYVARGADGDCFGFTDSATVGWNRSFTFGQDPTLRQLQLQVLTANSAPRPDDLVVVLLAELSCRYDGLARPAGDAGCANGRHFAAEQEELRGLWLAQLNGRASGHQALHVVLANAGGGGQYAGAIAEQIVAHRASFGQRLVVLGATGSRQVTRQAAVRLVQAGIQYVAPFQNADAGLPGRPLVDHFGFLQLTAPADEYAQDAVRWLTGRVPAPRRLAVYAPQDPSDLYTTSLTRDLLGAAAAHGMTATRVTSPQDLDPSVCRPGPAQPAVARTAVFFAGRQLDFQDFAAAISALCAPAGPDLVIADDEIATLMEDDTWRASTDADWPLAYYPSGMGCPGLVARSAGVDTTRELLGLAGSELGVDCRTRALAPQVTRVFDAVRLAAEVAGTSDPATAATTPARVIPLAEADVTVAEGQVVRSLPVPAFLCVWHVRGISPRTASACDTIFPAAATGRSQTRS
jgi:hypothetical protein